MEIMLELEVIFGEKGNSARFQTAGWSKAEPGFTWALGRQAELELTALRPARERIVVLQGHPFVRFPELASQAVRVYIGKLLVDEFRARGPFTRIIRIREDLLSSGFVLQLVQPESRSPAEFGASDTRQLGIAWSRIRIFTSRYNHTAAVSGRGRQKRGAGDRPSVPENLEVTKFPDSKAIKIGSDFLDDEDMLRGLRSGESSVIESKLRAHSEFSKVRMCLSTQLPEDPSIVRLTLDSERNWTVTFSSIWQGSNPEPPASKLIAWHFTSVLPILAAYASSDRIPGSTMLNLGDDPHTRGLSFCARFDENALIPDPYFLRSRAYMELQTSFLDRRVPFGARRPVALWRGSTTGDRGQGGLLDLPRIQLCLLGKRLDNQSILDFGVTNAVQLKNDDELEEIAGLGLFSDFIPPERFSDWMFHIDIDGNTNSWPGLFQKLLSGGLVFKVASPAGWRQWYYDRMQPYVHFVPVSSDLGDLVSKVKYYSYNLGEAERIATAGQQFASGLSFFGEIMATLQVIEDAILQDILG